MFEFNNQVVGSIVALLFIVSCTACILYFTRKLIAEDKILFLLMFLMILLATTWAIDSVIAINTSLLSDEQNKTILEMMKAMANLTLGYFIGNYKKKEDDSGV